jgi:hypothetical protein
MTDVTSSTARTATAPIVSSAGCAPSWATAWTADRQDLPAPCVYYGTEQGLQGTRDAAGLIHMVGKALSVQEDGSGGELELCSRDFSAGSPQSKPSPPTWRLALLLRCEQASTAFRGYLFCLHLARAEAGTSGNVATDWLLRFMEPQISAASHAWAAESSSIGITQSAWTIVRAVDQALASAADEHFEDGMETSFSRTIQVLVRTSPDSVLGHLIRLVHGAERPNVLSEALRWIGDMRDADSHDQRRTFLEAALLSPASEVRDGAALALSFLGDREALAALREAVARERLPELQTDLALVVRDLEVGANRSA